MSTYTGVTNFRKTVRLFVPHPVFCCVYFCDFYLEMIKRNVKVTATALLAVTVLIIQLDNFV